MKIKKYHTAGSSKIQKEIRRAAKPIKPNKNMTTHFPGLAHAIQ
jgi:hypothetical protein